MKLMRTVLSEKKISVVPEMDRLGYKAHSLPCFRHIEGSHEIGTEKEKEE